MIVDGEVPAAAEHASDCRGDEWCSAAVVTHPITPGQKTVTGGGGTERNRSKGHQQSSGDTSYISTATSLLWNYVGEC